MQSLCKLYYNYCIFHHCEASFDLILYDVIKHILNFGIKNKYRNYIVSNWSLSVICNHQITFVGNDLCVVPSLNGRTHRFFNHTLLNTKHDLVFDSVGDKRLPPATIAPTMHFIILSPRQTPIYSLQNCFCMLK